MVLNNGTIKCDECGKFMNYKNCHIFYQPDTIYNVERIEHFHKEHFHKEHFNKEK
jgi:hypothetical protein